MRPVALSIAALTACGVFAAVVPAQAAVQAPVGTSVGSTLTGIKVSGGTYRKAPVKTSGGTYRKLTNRDGTYQIAGGTYRKPAPKGGTYGKPAPKGGTYQVAGGTYR